MGAARIDRHFKVSSQEVLGLATSLLGLLQTDPAAAQTEAVRLLEE